MNLRVYKCGKFPGCLKSLRTVWKVSRQSGNFLVSLENFQTVWKVFRRSGKFTDSLKSFKTVWTVSFASNLVEALRKLFGDDFKDPFIEENKDIFDFRFMLGH